MIPRCFPGPLLTGSPRSSHGTIWTIFLMVVFWIEIAIPAIPVYIQARKVDPPSERLDLVI